MIRIDFCEYLLHPNDLQLSYSVTFVNVSPVASSVAHFVQTDIAGMNQEAEIRIFPETG